MILTSTLSNSFRKSSRDTILVLVDKKSQVALVNIPGCVKDRRLLDCLIDVCVNESVLNLNRYKFSASAEFFVPNKTLYKDYLEFLKTLPGDSDNDVIDLDPTCSMVKHLDNGLGFLRSLAKTNQSLEDSSPTASDVTDAGLSTDSIFS